MLKGGLPTATTYYKKHKISKGETIAQSLKERFDYGQNPDKTEDGELISSYGCDHMTAGTRAFMETVIAKLEEIRLRYLETKNKDDWYDMIQLLPSSYNQMRTCSFNYETLINIYYARKDHKLAEWHTFCDWIKTLPYGEELIIGEGK